MLTVACLLGCDQTQTAPASGVVFVNGEPLTGYENAFIRVEPSDFTSSSSRIDPKDGSFELVYNKGEGVALGEHPVAIIVNVSVGSDLYWIVPETFADAATSGLSVNIEGPTEGLRVELEVPGGLSKAPKADTSGDVAE